MASESRKLWLFESGGAGMWDVQRVQHSLVEPHSDALANGDAGPPLT